MKFSIPSPTCPVINSIKETIEASQRLINDAYGLLDDALNEIESVRDDNASLREAAEGYKELYEKTLGEFEELNCKGEA